MAVTPKRIQRGLDALDLSHTPARDAVHVGCIIAARTALDEADRHLHDSVIAAREAGDSWTTIGAAFDIARQAAQQRFGRPGTSPRPRPAAPRSTATHQRLLAFPA